MSNVNRDKKPSKPERTRKGDAGAGAGRNVSRSGAERRRSGKPEVSSKKKKNLRSRTASSSSSESPSDGPFDKAFNMAFGPDTQKMIDEFTQIAKEHQPPKKGRGTKKTKSVAPPSAQSQMHKYLGPVDPDLAIVLPPKGEPSLSDKYGVYAITALSIILQVIIAWATSRPEQES